MFETVVPSQIFKKIPVLLIHTIMVFCDSIIKCEKSKSRAATISRINYRGSHHAPIAH